MAMSKVDIETKEIRVTRDVHVLKTLITEDEVQKLLLEHVLKREISKLGLGHREQIQTTIEPMISWRSEEFEGFEIRVIFGDAT